MVFKFIDLFAGLGGFHTALSKLGGTCVFASEINANLAELYEKNYGIIPYGDIKKSYLDVPAHDVLCAGFPCQPFSKAGEQLGFDCPQWGDLFNYVTKIIERRKPNYLIIENVPNLFKHDSGKTWKKVEKKLVSLGYDIKANKLSPHMFGIPQIRERAIIVGCRSGLDQFEWPSQETTVELNIRSILDKNPSEAKSLSQEFVTYLNAWQNLINKLPKATTLPSFPLWGMEFGATYPYEAATPYKLSRQRTLESFRGTLGKKMKGTNWRDYETQLPPYARNEVDKFPEWKVKFIQQNREFYKTHKKIIDVWLPSIKDFSPSFQKLEWNWKGGPKDLWQTVIQFRASGIRAKKPTASPALVALTSSQVPVIAWEKRYMTVKECARLQSLDGLKVLPPSYTGAFRALGNAVNANVIQFVARNLIQTKPSVSALKRSKRG